MAVSSAVGSADAGAGAGTGTGARRLEGATSGWTTGLDAEERLAFERLLQWLRLSFLAVPLLVLLAFGLAAWPYAALIEALAAASFLWGWLLLRYNPSLQLRLQLPQRVVDCLLVFVVLTAYHGFLGNAYYDVTYLVFVVAAAATHGRLGGSLMAVVAAALVLTSRLVLMAGGRLNVEARQFTDVVFYLLIYLMVASAVAWLMQQSAAVAARHEARWSAEMAQRNAELERSIEVRDAVLTGVSHDLRSPLTAILATAQLGQRRASGPDAPLDALRTGFKRIEGSARQMDRWIQELVEAAALRSGEPPLLDKQPADLRDLVERTVDRWQSQRARSAVLLQADTGEPLRGEWDAARLERVLDNLVGNAVKYSPNGGDIRVAVGRTVMDGAEWGVVTVKDQGIGIPSAELGRVFEPFQRASNAAGHARGSGIGLWGSRELVRLHGGRIEVESQEGVGSTFRVYLPLG